MRRMIAQLKEQIGGTGSLSRDEWVPRSLLRADGRSICQRHGGVRYATGARRRA